RRPAARADVQRAVRGGRGVGRARRSRVRARGPVGELAGGGAMTEPLPVDERVRVLEELLVEKGIVDPAAMASIADLYDHEIGPMNGARVVAKAWLDPAYRDRLLADGTAAIAELGFGGPEGQHLVAVANEPDVHNV